MFEKYKLLFFVLIIIIFIILIVFINKKIQNNIYKKLVCELEKKINEELSTQMILNKNRSLYDFQINIDKFHFYIKLYTIPNYSEIVINSKNTWELRYGSGRNVGKMPSHKEYLSNVNSFTSFPTKENDIKIALFYYQPKKITRYLNESEIDFVKPYDKVHGLYFMGYDDFMDVCNIKHIIDKELKKMRKTN